MSKINQNDIKGRNHSKYGKGFSCIKCILWVEMGEDDIDSYNGCSKLYKRDYHLHDGCCPFSYNEFKLLNKKHDKS
jgi:hypothetical protein